MSPRDSMQPKHLGVGLSERSATVMTCKQLHLQKTNKHVAKKFLFLVHAQALALQHYHVLWRPMVLCHAFLTFEDNRRANEMRLSESRPAKKVWNLDISSFANDHLLKLLQALTTCHTMCICATSVERSICCFRVWTKHTTKHPVFTPTVFTAQTWPFESSAGAIWSTCILKGRVHLNWSGHFLDDAEEPSTSALQRLFKQLSTKFQPDKKKHYVF